MQHGEARHDGADPEEGAPVCYVCLEGGEARSPLLAGMCDCGAPLHEECLLRMIERGGSTRCGICTSSLRVVLEPHGWKLAPSALPLCGAYVLFAGVIVAFVFATAAAERSERVWMIPYVALFSSLNVTFIVILHVVLCRQRRGSLEDSARRRQHCS